MLQLTGVPIVTSLRTLSPNICPTNNHVYWKKRYIMFDLEGVKFTNRICRQILNIERCQNGGHGTIALSVG